VRRAVIAVVAPYALINGGKGIDRISEQTGGDLVRSDQPAEALAEQVGRIRTRYNLYYATPQGSPGVYRGIRVELSGPARSRYPDARLFSRRGYRPTNLNSSMN